MIEYKISFRHKDRNQIMTSVLGWGATLDDYEMACRDIVAKGHTEVKLLEVVRSERPIKLYEAVNE